jgi:hypothetical protein
MSGIGIAALSLVALWLGLLTLVAILSVRQMALLTAEISLNASGFSVLTDGPEVGRPIPDLLGATLAESGLAKAHVVLLSANCVPCRELVVGLKTRRLPNNIVALVTGRETVAGSFVELMPKVMRVVRDPLAQQLALALQIKSTPFAVSVAEGAVTRKRYLRSAADFVALVEDSGLLGGHIDRRSPAPEEAVHAR